ncbi:MULTISPECIES: hypothetical protein [Streptomyces]|uniref:SLATT domain-containing protein n=1 Tax=Streptomyces californicus TaxID=67351 RepID=A0ABD7D9Q4_9ACTN|nr:MULTISPECIES: hypothetical protein [Streptomyces]QRV39168.1 hypothetical protein I6J42_34380 [Streptomyces californicus]QRV52621.1 hypothetical protein I6J43_34400 [Streptomyces californicus]
MTVTSGLEPLAQQEFEDIRDKAAAKASRADGRVKFWNAAHVGMGATAAAAAAAAGGAGLADAGMRVLAGALALVSASLTATLGFVRTDQRIAGNKRSHRAWTAVERAARAELVMLSTMSAEETRDALSRVHQAYDSAHEAYGTTAPQS